MFTHVFPETAVFKLKWSYELHQRWSWCLNTEKYHQNLIHHVIPSGQHLIGPDFIFRHNNDHKHTTNAVKHTWIENHTMDTIPETVGLQEIKKTPKFRKKFQEMALMHVKSDFR